ncbi:MAG: hypothetical protein L6406_13165 [Desulfobacterales bacterium]|nr:hypothetical protein [Desulfobacterales bacterium]
MGSKSIRNICVKEKHIIEWVKVNVPVDRGVKGIVFALSEFPCLETVESCEGNDACGPWVCFRYGSYWDNDWRELADFVLGFLALRLNLLVGDDANLKIQTTPSGNIFGELSVRPRAAPQVEAALKELSQEFSVFQRHNSGYCDGTSGTSQ